MTVPPVVVSRCPQWSTREHVFTSMLWIDADGKRHGAPPKGSDRPPDVRRCVCGAEMAGVLNGVR